MLINFISLPSSLQIVAWSGFGVGMTFAGKMAVYKIAPRELAHAHNGEVGTIMAVGGVFYGLIIATMLVRAVTHFDAAVDATQHEATRAAAFYRASVEGSPELARRVQAPLLEYLRVVMRDEWPRQMRGLPIEPAAPQLAALSMVLRDYEPATPKQVAYLQQTQVELNQLYAARHARLANLDTTIPEEIWIINLLGELMLILFAWMMHIPRKSLQLALVAGLAISISIVLAATLIYDTPFYGDIAVSETPYRHALNNVAHSALSY